MSGAVKRLAATACIVVLSVAMLPSPANAAALVFAFPSRAETGDTVVAELSNATGPSEDFTIDWGDGAPPGLFGDLISCTVSIEGGTYAPGEPNRESGSCTLKHAYRSPGTFHVTATTKKTQQTFSSTIIVTGPALHKVAAQFTFTGLGPTTTNTTQFTVTATGPAPVCWMQYNDVRANGSAPATFTLDIGEYSPNTESDVVDVRFCDGGEDLEFLPTTVPFLFHPYQKFVSVGPGADRKVSWYVDNTTTEVATVSLLSNGVVLGSATAPPGGDADLTLTVPTQPARVPTRHYTLVTTTPSGLRTELPAVGTRGWSFDDERPGPLATPCSTTRWSYDRQGQPRSSSRMLQDIDSTLRRIGALSGLTFSRTADPTAAQLRFRWTRSESFGSWETTWKTGEATIATIDLGSKSWYAANTWRGFSPDVRRGVPGHNWFLAKSVLGTLGLGATSQSRNLMNGIVSEYTNQWQPQNARFGTGDRAGLDYLYHPKTCPRTR